ncbi:guanylate cyclase [Spiribacter salinus M19-40]|jgi:class 3 adenylate cyclase|uniref:Guanylate cyclase n=2 Tax=Spiribacter salinus TaxID=1335746 RepID=R4VD34_9GAMM|nr:adenylate/guanylate cyclase domain-containing protein [Spiribacter salinus]AGM40216.1 guanylate cyclase [Spiribacter salinus M19-40]TQF00028.1 MAG: adenylate/guanylate cyclase domain-containing protein [Spiribacter salinus]
MATWGPETWFYRYLAAPIREVLEDGGGGEQRLKARRYNDLCVLFTDIRGFTALSQTIDPDLLSRTVGIHARYQSQSVERFGGYVDSFFGDGLMAIFEGDGMEARACQCALEVMEQSHRPPESADVRAVPIGIGIHSGSVVRGSFGSEHWQTYTTIGAAVNIAARLCDHAAGTEIVISDTVRQALPWPERDGAILFDPVTGEPPRDVDPGLPLYRIRRG